MIKRVCLFITSLCLLFCCLLSGCTESAPKMAKFSTANYFNCFTEWVYSEEELTDEAAAALWQEIKGVMAEVEKSISSAEEESCVSRFNRAGVGETVELDGTAYAIFCEAKTRYRQTAGAYNPAIGLLIDLWGFSPRFSGGFELIEPYDRAMDEKGFYPLPNEAHLTAFSSSELIDFEKVELFEREGKFYAKKPLDATCTVGEGELACNYTMQLNFGGMGKGYCVDRVAEILAREGLKYGYFSVGGSSLHVLQDGAQSPDDAGQREWTIGVRNPRPEVNSEVSYCEVKWVNLSLSSSGDYEKYYEIDGVRYCHIIHPNTGYPVNSQSQSGIVAASVFGLSACTGDATSTALMVMGKEGAIDYIHRNLQGKDALFLYYDGGAGKYTLYTTFDETKLSMKIDGIDVVRIDGTQTN